MAVDSAHRTRILRRGPRLAPILFALFTLLLVPPPAVAQQGCERQGWDRDEVRVQAIVQARADSERRAREILDEIAIRADGTRVESEGPRMQGRRHEGWHVSYRIRAPRSTDLRLDSTNGGLDVTGIGGDLDLVTTNGRIDLYEASGSVRARTSNGGIDVRLSGSTWRGSGLNARTTNGRIGKELSGDLNGGGPTVRLETTNGGLSIRRR